MRSYKQSRPQRLSKTAVWQVRRCVRSVDRLFRI